MATFERKRFNEQDRTATCRLCRFRFKPRLPNHDICPSCFTQMLDAQRRRRNQTRFSPDDLIRRYLER